MRQTTNLRCLAVLLAGAALATTVHADFYLVRRIVLNDFFGPLGNNPSVVTSDGTYAYVAGYSGEAAAREIGILRLNLLDPAVDTFVLPDGAQTVNQFRYYGGVVVKDGVLYALCDRPNGTTAMTNVRALDTTTGLLVPTFDGDFGTGNGIVYEPAAMTNFATGGLAFDPGVGGVDSGLSLLGYSRGRRAELDINDGFTWYDLSDGMLAIDNTGACTVSESTAWRDHVYDANGNLYSRHGNHVQVSYRSGPNAIGSYAHLTDEVTAAGDPLVGCGDGKPVQTKAAAAIIGQNIEFIPASSAGTTQDLVIFNDRSTAAFAQSFANTVRVITATGDLSGVSLLRGGGEPLTTTFDTPSGSAWYDFQYDAANDRLLVLDAANRNLLVFSGTRPCGDPRPDSDGNGTVDALDADLFVDCLNGPGNVWPGLPVNQTFCGCVDAGGDNDVDLMDLAILQVLASQ